MAPVPPVPTAPALPGPSVPAVPEGARPAVPAECVPVEEPPPPPSEKRPVQARPEPNRQTIDRIAEMPPARWRGVATSCPTSKRVMVLLLCVPHRDGLASLTRIGRRALPFVTRRRFALEHGHADAHGSLLGQGRPHRARKSGFPVGAAEPARDFHRECGWVGTPAATPGRSVVDASYAFALTLRFTSLAAHDAYQTDPIHDAFHDRCAKYWNKVAVYDYDDVAG